MADQLDLAPIQAAIHDEGLDGWLFFDHHIRDAHAYRVLRFDPPQLPTRRWYYFVPSDGAPTKLQHRIEPHILDALPGIPRLYSSWRELEDQLAALVKGLRRVAMQYSPRCNIPYVAMADAGTIELVRELGPEVVTSADLVQLFEARWGNDQLDMHLEAGRRVDAIRQAAFAEIATGLADGRSLTEFNIRAFILSAFDRDGICTDHGPIVAVNANASDPHYEPSPSRSAEIRKGDLVLIDLWGKLRLPKAVYYDITWTGFCGASPPNSMDLVFDVVSGARDAAFEAARSALASGQPMRGCDVDDVAREFIDNRGYAEFFIHRTGHSIGEDVHGAGANMDNFETRDQRKLIAGCCFSIEPGVYLPDFGIRSEVNAFVEPSSVIVTGERQTQLLRLLP
jgi:Xaa-Pro dipeptidase